MPSARPPLIGRTSELAKLRALLSGGRRLVTLHGPPGVGKTEIAHALAGSEPCAIFCDLTPAQSYEDVAFVVAGALGVSLAGGKELGRALAGGVPEGTLLVLDGAEGAPDAVARIAVELDSVRRLVTSRELLRVEGEVAVSVEPLGDDDAVALFVRAAERSRPGFEIAPHATDLRTLVRVLSGVPLAIVLAASRLSVMDVPSLLARTRERLDLLASRQRGAPDRHASLRGAFESSVSTLAAGERATLAQCTVFRGPFSLAAAEHVVRAELPVADALQSLVEKSLLQTREEEGAGLRFGMLDIVRRLSVDVLGEAPADARDRHASYFAAAASTWDQASWYGGVSDLPRITEMRDNLLAAHAHAAGTPDGLRALIGLYPTYAARGPYDALAAMLDDARDEHACSTAEPELASRFFLVRGRILQLCGRRDEGAASFERSLQQARKCGVAVLAARALAWLAFARRTQGSLAEARERFEASAALFREAGDPKSESVVLSGLAALDLAEGDLDGARRALESAIDVLIVSDEPATAAMMRVDLGIVMQEMGDLEGARAVYEAAIVAHRGAGNRRHEGITLGYLGTLEDEQGRTDAAEVALTQALGILGEVGDRRYLAIFGACLAAVHAQRGEAAAARVALVDAEQRAQGQEPRVVAAVSLHRLRVEVAAGKTLQNVAERRGAVLGLLQQSDDVRFAARMLDRVLVPEPTPSQAARALALCVAEDASWLELPGGKRVELGRRAVHRRLVQRLLRERLGSPGVPLPLSELVAAGWPGEKLSGPSAQNRLHVALATLRADGLRDHLKRVAGGYFLDPSIEVRVER